MPEVKWGDSHLQSQETSMAVKESKEHKTIATEVKRKQHEKVGN